MDDIIDVKRSDLITMSKKAHQEEMKRVIPPLLKQIDNAVQAGRPVKVKAKRLTRVVNKDDDVKDVPKDGRSHVKQSRFMEVSFLFDTGNTIVSK